MYQADVNRYVNSGDGMKYRRLGNSGIVLPEISLGLWHNFGSVDNYVNYSQIAFSAFDSGITHFDLANNYGPVPGSAESNFGRILKNGLMKYRDELIISTKAGYIMWDGPYGDGGSRKYLISSLNQSLKRMGLDYVDIFYSHRPDPNTPIEETMEALSDIVRSGKALYVGISNYNPEQTRKAVSILRENKTPCLIHQGKYSMLVRTPEEGLLDTLGDEKVGFIAFSPLAQGMLTNKYLKSIPENSRAARASGYLKKEQITDDILCKVRRLNELALERGETMAQMATSWLLRDGRVSSVLVGASSVAQLKDNISSIHCAEFSSEELELIDSILL